MCLFCKPPLTHILVLGGGHTNDSRLSETALARLAESIRLHRQLPGSILITSGWSGKRESVPQASDIRPPTSVFRLLQTMVFVVNEK